MSDTQPHLCYTLMEINNGIRMGLRMNGCLLVALKKRLHVDLSAMSLLGSGTEGAVIRPVHVHIGNLPPARSGDPAPQPFVLLAPVSGYLREGESTARVACVCSVYNPEEGDAEGAEMDMAALLSELARSLAPCCKMPLEGRYRLTPDEKGRLFPWEKSDMQPRPYLQATVMTCWRMKGPE